MRKLDFFIPYIVAPKQTKNNRIVKRGDGSSYVGRFTPKAVKENEAALSALLAPYLPEWPLEGPLRAQYTFIYGWLKKHRKKDRERGWLPKDTRPDCDNLAKQINDVMEKMGFFGNDAAIWHMTTAKLFMARPGVKIVVAEATDCIEGMEALP